MEDNDFSDFLRCLHGTGDEASMLEGLNALAAARSLTEITDDEWFEVGRIATVSAKTHGRAKRRAQSLLKQRAHRYIEDWD